jgi:hypothetical protein
MNLKKELQVVNKEIQALKKKVEKLMIAAGKIEKPKTGKANPVKKTAAKKPTSRKAAALTAIDAVFGVIKKSKKGVNTATLMKQTGFNEKKIFNNIYKLKKQGKIISKAKGIYVKA